MDPKILIYCQDGIVSKIVTNDPKMQVYLCDQDFEWDCLMNLEKPINTRLSTLSYEIITDPLMDKEVKSLQEEIRRCSKLV